MTLSLILIHAAAVLAAAFIGRYLYRAGIDTGRMRADDDHQADLERNDKEWAGRCEYCRTTGQPWYQS